jgi:hypothetical protein
MSTLSEVLSKTQEEFIKNLIRNFADWITENPSFADLERDELVQKLFDELKLEDAKTTKVAAVRGLGAAVDSKNRTKKTKPEWLELSQFMAKYGNDLENCNRCLFVSPRGEHTDKICGLPSVGHIKGSRGFTEQSYLSKRCESCITKAGKIQKLLDGKQTSTKSSKNGGSIPGYNQVKKPKKKEEEDDEDSKIQVYLNTSLEKVLGSNTYIVSNPGLKDTIIKKIDENKFALIGYKEGIDANTEFDRDIIRSLLDFKEMVNTFTAEKRDLSKKMLRKFDLVVYTKDQTEKLCDQIEAEE